MLALYNAKSGNDPNPPPSCQPTPPRHSYFTTVSRQSHDSCFQMCQLGLKSQTSIQPKCTYHQNKYSHVLLEHQSLVCHCLDLRTRLNILSLTLWGLTKYICRTAQLTSRRCILNIYSTNILAEYFKHAAYSSFFFSLSSRCRLFHNAIFFGSCNIHILNTECAKILKETPVPKR